MHIAEPEIAAAETVGDFLVIQPEQMLHGCPHVVDGADILHRVIAEFVRGSEGCADLDAAARQLDAEPKRIVVAPVIRLRERGPAKFSCPDDERLEFHREASATPATQRSADSLPASSCCIRLKHAGWQSALWVYARTAFATWPCTSVRRKSRPA